jgi:hypothetical protein
MVAMAVADAAEAEAEAEASMRVAGAAGYVQVVLAEALECDLVSLSGLDLQVADTDPDLLSDPDRQLLAA